MGRRCRCAAHALAPLQDTSAPMDTKETAATHAPGQLTLLSGAHPRTDLRRSPS
jgi:hypothetical protein